MEISNEQNQVYLSRRIQDLEQLRVSKGQDLLELGKTIGHRLKGHGNTFGFPDISLLGKEIEEAAINKNTELLEELIAKFEKIVKGHYYH